MTITATIIADSTDSRHARITTMQLRYPRFVHAEFMTHRVFSRNASSSRAIPVARLIQDIIDDTAMPIHWGKNQKGMQADEEHNALVGRYFFDTTLEGQYLEGSPQDAWNFARDCAIIMAKEFDKAGYHKQIVNRLLEPFSHINVIVTATDWQNFFDLRLHPDAQPEMQKLARQMKIAMDASTPELLGGGEWHLPYVTREEMGEHPYRILKAISAARCARVSYMTHDGIKPRLDDDMDLANRLLEGHHMSPFEHQATPDAISNYHANFFHWKSYRKEIEQ